MNLTEFIIRQTFIVEYGHRMRILGIETSCDETSAAVVEDGCYMRSNVIYSQIELHRKTGGVVPEVAAREHIIKIIPVIDEALKNANCRRKDLDAIAVTYGPGLLTSLLTGINTANTLALTLGIPLIPVNHIEGHMYANWIRSDTSGNTQIPKKPKFPLVVLTASGGHNELILWHNHGKYRFLGSTLDDAAGEAFDKVARLLGLPYPGGPQISHAAESGDREKYSFPRAWVDGWNFSFSGLKTAVLRLVEKEMEKEKTSKVYRHAISETFINNVAASFEESVVDVLATKLARAAEKFGVKEAHLAGGVSANKRLRIKTRSLLPDTIELRYCDDIRLCTDNAAMIAAAGYFRYQSDPDMYQKWKPINGNPNLAVHNWN